MGDPYFHGIYSLGKEVNKRNHKETKIIVIAMKETYGVLKVSQRWEEARRCRDGGLHLSEIILTNLEAHG